ncbi:sugar phosphate isomerase/epimerase [Paenibacillus sp. GSMTC-2017]|uniref:sugar phosphate isomerase/epimerase family protein n=1 Tax=Paenibacillus sp. GSMTC-2017 TaxID=2794350 RepID=UPI0018D8848E|nr:sugar phosphate isomerase/epimerase [Paenibacillus sp. GSMTC-2017]MBH5320321.1 sugar phosphate isomerase/epimerase [Paenibacillus sp. GSMTC-2017]
MELGLFTRAYQEFDIDEAFQKIQSLGIKHIEVVANHGSKHLNLEEALTSNYHSRYQKALNDHGLRISSLTLHRDAQMVMGPHGEATQHFFKGTSEEQIEFGVKRAKLAADVAKEYEIPVVVGYLGCANFSHFFPWPYKEGWERQLKLTYERWMPILEYYERSGVIFAHEVGPQQIAYDLETALEISEMFNTSGFGICLDPSNLILVGVDPECFIEQLKRKIVHVHGKDAELTYKRPYSGWLPHGDLSRPDRGVRFRIPGWGDVNWKKVLTSLKMNGYNGIISIEYEDSTFNVEEGLEKSIDFLKPLLFK